MDERVPPNPDGLYSENRYFCEKLIEYYLGKYNNLKIAIIRFSSCYGYGDKPKFIYNFINKAIANEDICTHEYINGLPYMHLTHMNDVSEFLKVWFSKDSKIGYFNIAGNDFLSTRAIAEKIILEIGSSSMIKTNNINTYTANIFLDTQKIQNYFEWNPKLSFDDILPELIKKAKNDILCEKEKI